MGETFAGHPIPSIRRATDDLIAVEYGRDEETWCYLGPDDAEEMARRLLYEARWMRRRDAQRRLRSATRADPAVAEELPRLDQYRCAECGATTGLQHAHWVSLDDNTVLEPHGTWCYGDNSWCESCQKNTRLELVTGGVAEAGGG